MDSVEKNAGLKKLYQIGGFRTIILFEMVFRFGIGKIILKTLSMRRENCRRYQVDHIEHEKRKKATPFSPTNSQLKIEFAAMKIVHKREHAMLIQTPLTNSLQIACGEPPEYWAMLR